MKETTTNTNVANNVNNLVAEAYRLSKEVIPFVLEGSWAKHGPAVDWSPGECPLNQEEAERLLFESGEPYGFSWHEISHDGNILIVEAPIGFCRAEMTAAPLSDLHPDAHCVVKELGYHPTLLAEGTPTPAAVFTAVIEVDGGADPDLDFCKEKVDGKHVLVTWFPGPALPPSAPQGCNVGDRMTVAEAQRKGWKVATFATTPEDKALLG